MKNLEMAKKEYEQSEAEADQTLVQALAESVRLYDLDRAEAETAAKGWETQPAVLANYRLALGLATRSRKDRDKYAKYIRRLAHERHLRRYHKAP